MQHKYALHFALRRILDIFLDPQQNLGKQEYVGLDLLTQKVD